MDTDRLNRWLTLVANLGVIVGIVILAIEIRQNTATQELQMRMDRISGVMDPFFESPELLGVWAKVKAIDGLEPVAQKYMDRYQLTPEEAALWSRLVHRDWYVMQAQFITEGPSEDIERTIAHYYDLYPDFRIVFEANEDSALSDEFIEYVDSIVGDDLHD